MSSDQQSHGQVMLGKAWSELSNNPEAALRVFESELPQWEAFSRQSPGYIDASRGSLIAAVFARNNAAAQSAWNRITRDSLDGVSAEREPPGDQHAWAKDWKLAFRSYRDAGHFGTVESTDQVNRGLDEALKGHLARAIEIWSEPMVGEGMSDLRDVHLALIGVAFAAQNNWSSAAAAWLEAARTERTAPQLDMLYAGNVMALSMIFHFGDTIAKINAHQRLIRP